MTKIPIFVWLTIILVAELLLQWLPIPGVFLMMVGAPGWSVLLINGILISLAFDAWRGRLPKWVIAMPVVLYGAYVGYYIAARVEYVMLDHQMRSLNAGQSVAFNSEMQALLVDYSSRPSNSTPSYAYAMLSAFDLRSVYEFNYRDAGESRLSRIFGKTQCDMLKRNRRGPIDPMWFHIDRVFIKNACIGLSSDKLLSKSRVTLWPLPDEPHEGYLIKGTLQPLEVVTSDGAKIRLTTGTVRLPTLIPAPIIGCMLISSSPKWKCFAHMAQARLSVAGNHNPEQDGRPRIAGEALGLHPRKVLDVKGSRALISGAQGEIDLAELQ